MSIPKHLYCIVYRTGGTNNFQWHRSSAMSKADAQRAKKHNEKMGYKCYLVNYAQSVNIGLPTTYE